MPRKRRQPEPSVVPEPDASLTPEPDAVSPLERMGDAIIALAVRVDEMDRRLQQLFQPRERLLANGE